MKTYVKSSSSFTDIHVERNKYIVRLGMERTLMDDGTYDYDIVNYTINDDSTILAFDVFSYSECYRIEDIAKSTAKVTADKYWS